MAKQDKDQGQPEGDATQMGAMKGTPSGVAASPLIGGGELLGWSLGKGILWVGSS